jgi:threonine dehydrogenase-like Zn-dependent dehydrogenase
LKKLGGKKMKSLIMEGPEKSKIIDVPMPVIGENQLLVKVKYTGVCHSEMYPWSVASAGERFGHEPMGTVVEAGAKVKGFKAGDRVSGLGGGYAEYIAMDADKTVIIPDNIADEDAVIEPLSCLISAAARVPVETPGDAAAVVGCGYMGLGIISLLKLKGAGKIVAVDLREEALANALKFGADEAYTPDRLPRGYILNWDNWGKADLTRQGEQVDIFNTGFKTVVEFTGTESGLRLAGDMVSAHGFLGIGGYHNDYERTIDFKLWNVKAIMANSLHERRSGYQTRCCKQAVELISSGKWNFTGLATHIYSLDEFDKANEAVRSKPAGHIKAIVRS